MILKLNEFVMVNTDHLLSMTIKNNASAEFPYSIVAYMVGGQEVIAQFKSVEERDRDWSNIKAWVN